MIAVQRRVLMIFKAPSTPGDGAPSAARSARPTTSSFPNVNLAKASTQSQTKNENASKDWNETAPSTKVSTSGVPYQYEAMDGWCSAHCSIFVL